MRRKRISIIVVIMMIFSLTIGSVSQITIAEAKAAVSVSKKTITITKGSTIKVKVNTISKVKTLSCKVISGKKNISCSWTGWNGNTNKLKIKGKKIGSSKIRITNSYNKSTITIKVKVKKKAATVKERLTDLCYNSRRMSWVLYPGDENFWRPDEADADGEYPLGITYTLTDPNDSISYNEFTWTSSNNSVATIGSDGTVYAKGVGTTRLTCSYGIYSTYMDLTISDGGFFSDVSSGSGKTTSRLKSLRYSLSSFTWHIEDGDDTYWSPWEANGYGDLVFDVEVEFSDPDDSMNYDEFNWTSSNKSVATIGSDGTVYAKSSGTTTLTCSYGILSTSMTLTVIMDQSDVSSSDSGSSSNDSQTTFNKCPTCNGSGKILCNTCGGTGYKVCPLCIGGYRTVNGNRVACTTCGATGKLQCAECHGTIIYNCTTCGGDGKV